jgi:Kiwa KwaB-like protein
MSPIPPDLIPALQDPDFSITHLLFLLRPDGGDGTQQTDGSPGADFVAYQLELEQATMTGPVAGEFQNALCKHLKTLSGLTPVAFSNYSLPQAGQVQVIPVKDVPMLRELIAKIRGGGLLRLPQVAAINGKLLGALAAYAVIVESQGRRALYFRKSVPSRVIRADGAFKLFFDGQLLSKISTDVFSFDGQADAVVIEDEAFVFQRNYFEEMFDFVRTVYQPAADLAVAHIQDTAVLSDTLGFADACRGDVDKLRKLADIGQNIGRANLTWDAIQDVQAKWNVPVELDSQKRCIVFKKADTWSILKLLDDDYLRSDMTGALYEVQSKRRIKRPGKPLVRKSQQSAAQASGGATKGSAGGKLPAEKGAVRRPRRRAPVAARKALRNSAEVS